MNKHPHCGLLCTAPPATAVKARELTLALRGRFVFQIFAAFGECPVQFLHQCEEFLVVTLERDARAKLVNSFAHRLVHRKSEVLQQLKVGVCSLSNANRQAALGFAHQRHVRRERNVTIVNSTSLI